MPAKPKTTPQQKGFTDAKSIEDYLKSKEGQKLIKEIHEKRQEQEEKKEQILKIADTEQQLKDALLLQVEGKEEEAKERLKSLWHGDHEEVVQRIQKDREAQYKEQQKTPDKAQVVKQAEHVVGLLEKEEKTLDEKIKDLEKEKARLEAKHKTHNDALEEIKSYSKLSQNGKIDTGILKEKQDELQKKIDKLADEQLKVADELTNAGGADYEKYEKKYREIKAKVDALSLKLGALKDMEAVSKGVKYYADENGKRLKASDNINKAHFVLKEGESIRKDKDGNYCLYKEGEDPKDEGDCRRAQERYERHKQEIAVVSDFVQGVHRHENERNKQDLATAIKNKLIVQTRIGGIKTQLAKLKTSGGNAGVLTKGGGAKGKEDDDSKKDPYGLNALLKMVIEANSALSEGLGNAIKNKVIKPLKEAFDDKSEGLGNTVKDKVEDLGSTLKNKGKSLLEALPDTLQCKDVLSKAINFVASIINGISEKLSQLKGIMSEGWNSLTMKEKRNIREDEAEEGQEMSFVRKTKI